jgi:hypothetical protein
MAANRIHKVYRAETALSASMRQKLQQPAAIRAADAISTVVTLLPRSTQSATGPVLQCRIVPMAQLMACCETMFLANTIDHCAFNRDASLSTRKSTVLAIPQHRHIAEAGLC